MPAFVKENLLLEYTCGHIYLKKPWNFMMYG
jgi:hypothetical protein